MVDIVHDNSNDLVEGQLTDRIAALEKVLGCDTLTFIGPIIHHIDDDIRDAVEGIPEKKNRLAVVLETLGGYIEVARRIAATLRHHYQRVDFIVPNQAMSAGTVLAMSGDAIYMDYYSVLGPIDPQVSKGEGEGFVPALGYLVQFDRLLEKDRNGQLSDAELAILLRKFDPAELYRYEQERELSIELLKEWLVQYKFKDWAVTEGRNMPVTEVMKEQRAEEIAQKLNATDRWHSHARGIPMSVLANELKLRIGDFGLNRELNTAIRSYYRLLQNYLEVRGDSGVVHTRVKFSPFKWR